MSGSLAALVTVRGRRAWLLLCALLVLVFAATPAVAQQVVNTATVSPPDGVVDPDTDNNEATDETPIVQVATSKSSSPASGEAVSVGQTITYTLAVEVSGGPLPADVVLTDTIGPGQTLDAGSLPSGCSSSTGGGGETIVTCTVPADSAAGTYTFEYSTTVDVDATDSVSNSVEPNVGTCDDCETDHPLAPPAVTYNKSADTAGPVSVGDVITYTLTATVTNSQLVTDLVLTDTLGVGLTFGSVTNAGAFTCTGSLSCTLPAGTVPGTYTVTYTATVNDQATGTVSNAVLGDQGTCDADCDVDVPVTDPSVTYAKTADTTGPVSVGDVITYTLTATVTNSQLVTDLVLTDTLGVGLTFGSVTNAGAFTCTGSLSCTLPAGTVPGTYTVTYTATVNDQATGTVSNAVLGDQGTCDADCDVDVPVTDPSVTYNKSADTAGPVSVGDVITYTLTATVTNSQLVTDLVLTDTLGVGLTFGSVTNAGAFTCTGSLSCTLPAGTVPGTYTVTYTATVNDQATGTVSNAVLGDQGTCDADCDVDVPVTDPSVTYNKSADTAGPVSVGDVITYTLTATVTNSQLVTDLVLTDTLGVGLTFGSVTNAGAFTCTGSLSCTLPAGTVPGTYTVTYTATVNDQATGTVSNAVLGDQGTCDADCDVDVPVTDPSVTYAKTADTAGPVSVGDVITYTLTATVTNSQLVTDLVLTDTLGVGLTFGSVTNAGAFTCTGSLSCTLPAGTVPGKYTVTYTATVNDQATGTVSNAVLGDQGTCDADCDVDVPVTDPSVTYNKSADTAGPVSVGDVITYTLTATVTNSQLVTDLVLTDTLGVGLTFGSVTNAGAFTCTGSLSCTLPAGTVPGTYTVTYTATVNDQATGTVSNAVLGDQGTCDADCDVDVPVTDPSVTYNKSADTAGPVSVGDVITYTLTATVTNSQLVTDLVLTDTLGVGLTFGSVTNAGAFTCTGSLSCTLPAGTVPGTYTVTYTATVNDQATGTVSNAVLGDQGTCDADCDVDVPVTDPSVTYNKSADTAGPVSVGDVITYTLTATVTNSQLVTDLVLTDTLGVGLTFGSVTNAGAFTCTGSLSCTLPAGTVPGTYTVTYTATVNDQATGTVSNAVVGDQGTCDADCDVDVPVTDPSVTYAKTADTTGPVSVGDVITYTLTATVTNSQLVTDLVLTDTLGVGLTFGSVTNAGAFTCTGSLSCTLPAGTVPGTYTVTYTATVNDQATGTVSNAVLGDQGTCDADCDVDVPVTDPSVTYNKSADTAGPVSVGDVITYTLTATVTNSQLVTDLVLTDTLGVGLTFGSVTNAGAFTCTGSLSCTLPAGTVPGTYTVTYTATVNDQATGTVSNAVLGDQGTCDADCDVDVPVTDPSVTYNKSADTAGPVSVGDVITYTLTATVTNSQLVTDLVLTDTLGVGLTFGSVTNAGAFTCTGSLSCTLPAGTVPGTYTVTYTATVNDQATGTVSNAVLGDQGTCDADCDVDVPVTDPSVTYNKSADTAGPVSVGDVITYTLTATVTNSQLVTDLVLTDTLGVGLTFGSVTNAGAFTCTGSLSCTLPAGTVPGTYTVTYTATVNDQATGTVSNAVLGDQGTCDADCDVDVPVTDPSVTYNKSADTAGPVSVGDVITYTLTATVTNSQLVTDLVLTDTLGVGLTFGSVTNAGAFTCTGSLSCTLPAGTVPGTYTVTYTATVNDQATGTVSNAVLGDQGTCDADCDVDVPVTDPSVTYAKTADTAGPVSVGDVITYTLTATVTNSQLVTDLVLTDTLGVGLTFGSVTNAGAFTCTGSLSCTLPAGTVPGTYTVTYTATVNDQATGTVSNAVLGDQGTCDADCDVDVPVTDPSVTYNKSADTAGPVSVGDVITYTLTATVTNSQLVTDLVLTDTLGVGLTFGSVTNAGAFTCTGSLSCTLPAGTVPGTYTVTYTATVNDQATGTVSNAVLGDQGTCDADCDVDVPVTDPSVTYNKSADTAGPVSVGDVITYTLTATVTNSQLVTDLVLTDTLGVGLTFGSVTNAGAFTCTGSLSCTLPAGTVPGTYTVTYTATVNDQATGTVSNAVLGDQGTCDADCDVDVPVTDPSVTYAKTADTTGPVSVGDVITYTLTATVTNSQLVTDLVLTDTLGVGLTFGSVTNAGAFTCTGSLSCTLPAGTVPGTYTVTYTATVNDQATGTVSNAVLGDQGTCDADCDVDVPVTDPSVTYNKSADTAGPVSVGDVITYTLTATVTNSQLVTDLVLTDTLGVGLTFGSVTNAGAFTCTGSLSCTLPAGTVPGTYTVTYTATVNDQATGTVSNAVVGDHGTCDADCDVDVPVTDPSVTYAKTADTTGPVSVGDVITYTLTATVTNSQLVTDLVLTDTLGVGLTFGSVTNAGAFTCTGSLSCTLPAGTVPGKYTVTYTATVNDQATGTVSNAVLGDQGTCDADCDVDVPVTDPSVTYNKSADTAGPVSVGDVITYTLTATVTNSQLVTDLVLTDTLGVGLTFGSVTNAGAFTCTGSLSCTLPAGTVPGTYTVTYTATVNDQATGTVSNAVLGDQGTCDADCDVDVPVTDPSVTYNKSADTAGPVSVGDVITYTLTATVTNSQLVTDLVLTDTLGVGLTFGSVTNAGAFTCTGSLSCTLPAGTVPGTYTVTYTATVNDQATGTVSNAVLGDQGTCDADCDVDVPVTDPSVTYNKSADTAGPVSVGDVITYTLTATVTNSQLVTDLVLTDTLGVGLTFGSVTNAGAFTCTGSLSCTLPAGTVPGTYTVTYTATVNDQATGTVSNAVLGDQGTCDADCDVDVPVTDPSVTYNKSADTAGPVSVGDVITYTLTATVTNSQLVTDLVLTDTLGVGLTFGSVTNAGAFTCTGSLSCTLPAGTVPGKYTVSYTATVNDQATGTVSNAVLGDQGTCDADCDVDVPVTDPSVTYNKSADTAGPVSVGDVITYTLTATVTNSQLVTDLVLTDTLGVGLTFGSVTNAGAFTCTGSLSCTLPAGTVPGTYTVTYTATVNDQATGTVSNAVLGDQGTCDADCDVDVPVTDPSVTYNKSADTAGPVSVGDVITYTLTATVTNSQLVTDLVLTDTLGVGLTFGSVTNAGAFTCTGSLSCTLPAGTVPGTYTVTYTATVNDQATGTVSNAVLGDQGTCDADCDVDVPVTDPSVTYNKSADTAGPVSVGDVITYTLTATVTNSQLVTDLVLTDTLGVGLTFGSVTNAGAFTCTGSLSCTLPAGTVPGTYTVTYTATVNDQATGTVSNAVLGDQGTCDADCDVDVPVTDPSVTYNKSADTAGPVSVGDVITYTLTATVTNSQLVTDLVLTDTLGVGLTFGSVTNAGAFTCTGSLSCTLPAGTVPGTYTVSYTAVVTDAAVGTVRNAVVAQGGNDDPSGPPPSCAGECEVVTPVAAPTVTVVKSSDPASGEMVLAGQTVTYTLTIQIERSALAQDLVLTDTFSGGQALAGDLPDECAATEAGLTCTFPAGTAPGEYTFSYATVVEAGASGTIGNVVVAAGGGDEDPVCNVCSTEHPVGVPAIEAVKTATLTVDNRTPGVGNVGDVVTYTITVTNVGNVTVDGLIVTDSFNGGEAVTLTCAPAQLAPGESATCESYSHTITVEDTNVEDGLLRNMVIATATATSGTANPVTVTVTSESEAVVEVEQDVTTVRIVKQASPRDVRVGDLVRYTVVMENTGSYDLVNGTLVDMPPAGFTYVDGSLTVADRDGAGVVVGRYPVIRVEGLDIAAGETATVTYLLRVGAGVRAGIHTNSAVVEDGGEVISNVATADVQLVADPLLDESLIIGTVFNDRDGDGWQDSATMTGVHVQGGFAPGAYVANSTTVDRGNGPRPEPDASSPLLHGIGIGTIEGRQSEADPVERHQVVVSQLLTAPEFTDDFVLTTKEGITVRMDAEGNTRVERNGDAARGLTAAEPVVERRISKVEGGYRVDYVIGNAGIDERGIPGVRIASVEGLIVETDQFGRYHLVGIEGGLWERGRNFILKVDPATLPPGSEFTTDNPLVRRITPGLPVRFDFGVRLPSGLVEGGSKDVELELGEVLFAPGSAEVRQQYMPVIEAMAEKVRQYGGGEVVIEATAGNEALAFDRATAVRDALLSRLDGKLAKALRVSTRTQQDDPDSLVIGVDEGGLLLGAVMFDTDSSNIRPEFEPLLDRVAQALEKMGSGSIAIVGHTDIRASYEYNAKLGMRRAQAVFDALVKRLSPEVRARIRVDISNDPKAPVDGRK